MKVVLQRVSKASVHVKHELIGEIKHGLVVLLGIHQTDTKEKIEWMCTKIAKLRIFEDDDGKMNHSVQDVKGSVLVVSQFTLYGDARKGTRPSFIEAAHPLLANPLYEYFIQYFKNNFDLEVASGKFGAMMDVSLVNDGPVTLILER